MSKIRKLWELARLEPVEGLMDDASLLAQLARDYFKWCDENPRYKTEVIKHKMEWDTVEIELKRPYTMSGLCMHIGVAQAYFRAHKAYLAELMEAKTMTGDHARVLGVMEWIEQIVFTDQIEGAATGQYNANLVSRLNGLTDTINSNAVVDPVLRVTTRDAETAHNLNLLTAGL